MINNKVKGHQAETHAAAFLRRQGYTLLDRNYAYRGGELDIVAKTPTNEIVFAEVKSVWNKRNGAPESRVRRGKQFKLWRTACHYLYSHAFGFEYPCRFDVIAVNCENHVFKLKHFPGAFEAEQTIPEC